MCVKEYYPNQAAVIEYGYITGKNVITESTSFF